MQIWVQWGHVSSHNDQVLHTPGLLATSGPQLRVSAPHPISQVHKQVEMEYHNGAWQVGVRIPGNYPILPKNYPTSYHVQTSQSNWHLPSLNYRIFPYLPLPTSCWVTVCTITQVTVYTQMPEYQVTHMPPPPLQQNVHRRDTTTQNLPEHPRINFSFWYPTPLQPTITIPILIPCPPPHFPEKAPPPTGRNRGSRSSGDTLAVMVDWDEHVALGGRGWDWMGWGWRWGGGGWV